MEWIRVGVEIRRGASGDLLSTVVSFIFVFFIFIFFFFYVIYGLT